MRVRGPDSQDAAVWIRYGCVLTAAFSRREQPVVHRDVCLGRQQRRACLPEHPHRYVVSLHLTKLYNRSSPRHSTVDTHAPQSMWQYPPKAIHRHLPLCQPHVPFLDKPRNMLTRVQKSTASSPARPSTRARAARTSSAASARPCRSSRRPTQSRRRDAARRTHGVTMYCTCTLAAACDCDCGASTTRYACHVRCNAMQCNCANMSTSHVKFHGVQDVSFWSIYPLSTSASCLFVLPPHSPLLRAPGCARRAGLEV